MGAQAAVYAVISIFGIIVTFYATLPILDAVWTINDQNPLVNGTDPVNGQLETWWNDQEFMMRDAIFATTAVSIGVLIAYVWISSSKKEAERY